ncbi:MAG: hypothetical protein ACKO5K_03675 [Armatimonadota bacterium]
MHWGRRIGAVAAAIVSGGLTVGGLETAGHILFPVDGARVARGIIPVDAQCALGIAWTAGVAVASLVGGALGGVLGAVVGGAVLMSMTVSNFLRMPHPPGLIAGSLAGMCAVYFLVVRAAGGSARAPRTGP